jgi:uncharacterized SAM-binding protein YcdF (DUF218 family)
MIRALFGAVQLIAFIIVLTAVFSGGYFLYSGLTHGPDGDARGDGIVALTGGESRVQTGVQLLAEERGQRLLISGANPIATLGDIRTAAGAESALFECCVDVGIEAADTIGNAIETATWAAGHGYSRLVVVTSDFHMPRALLELRSAMPDTDLVAYGVKTAPPWADERSARRWGQEYLKYAAVQARVIRDRFAG